MQQLRLGQTEENLFEQIAAMNQLIEAFKAVKANRGAPGIDGVTIEKFAENLHEELQQLAQEVSDWSYEPRAVKRVSIPKPGGGERLLGIPCIRDRVVQYSLKMVLEPLYEPDFSASSYGFRPGRSQKQALEAAKGHVQKGKEWVVDLDLEKFFDRINHDRLMWLLAQKVKDKRVLRLIGMTLRSGVLNAEQIERTEEGTPQGSPLSPLLSNIVLDELDKEIEKRGLAFCRWADDCNIFVGSEKAAQRVMMSITKFIEERLKLKVNREKSKVALSKSVKFLGMTLVLGMLVIAPKSMAKAMQRVQELTPRQTHIPLAAQIETINRWYRGWCGYFQMTELPSQLAGIEAHIRRRLRAQMVTAQKRKSHLHEKLRKRGVPDPLAASIYKPSKGWHLSHCRAVERAWPNHWFATQGLYTLSRARLPHWQPLKVWLRLV